MKTKLFKQQNWFRTLFGVPNCNDFFQHFIFFLIKHSFVRTHKISFFLFVIAFF